MNDGGDMIVGRSYVQVSGKSSQISTNTLGKDREMSILGRADFRSC
jgi:hypothetical protein